MNVKYVWLVCCVLALNGCATVSQPSLREPINAQALRPSAYSHYSQSWVAQGAIAVQTAKKGWSASFNWLQKGNRYSLDIFGPLGSRRISLAGDSNEAVLITADQTQRALNAEILLQRRLGWYIPVHSARYWIRGLPAPGEIDKVLRNGRGELVLLEQQGWYITYESYCNIQGQSLPTVIELKHPRLFIRIVIREWES